MPKKIKEIDPGFVVNRHETETTADTASMAPSAWLVPKPIAEIIENMSNGELNLLRDKINEIIRHLNGE